MYISIQIWKCKEAKATIILLNEDKMPIRADLEREGGTPLPAAVPLTHPLPGSLLPHMTLRGESPSSHTAGQRAAYLASVVVLGFWVGNTYPPRR